jgi:choline dehydrogenase-like flavoprotein
MTQNSASVKLDPNQRPFDAIVIGSGMGALTFASVMARMRKWRVLVLERHFKIGGFTHTFSRPGGWTWDVGVHYVGEMGPGGACSISSPMEAWTGRPCRTSTMCSFTQA